MTLSTAAKTAAFSQDTGEAFLILLTIDHADFTVPIRVVNNTEDVTSNGEVYVAFPFSLTLPDEDENREVTAKLTIDNVSREITQALRLIGSPPTIDVSVIRAAAPNTLEISLPTFIMRDVVWDVTTVSGELVLGDITTEPYPQLSFTPGQFAGLF